MARIYVSSTRADLEAERRMVLDWLRESRHEAVHSYVADSDTVRGSCVADVTSCDGYVLIVGRRYGHEPADHNPTGLSITELEYEAARGKSGMPIIVLLLRYVLNSALTDLDDYAAYANVLSFRKRLQSAHRPAEIQALADLIPALELAMRREFTPKPLDNPEVRAIVAQLTTERVQRDQRIADLERENVELKEQRAAAVARTLEAAAAMGASPAQHAAAAALREGDTRPARELLQREERSAIAIARRSSDDAEVAAASRRAAELARERGALALHTDVTAALAAFREAAEHDPSDLWTWLWLGDMYVAFGNLSAADAAYSAAQRVATVRLSASPGDDRSTRDLSVSHNKIGDVRVAQGNLGAALQEFEAALALRERLATHDSANTEWQRDVSISRNKIGDVRVLQGNLGAALQAFEERLAVAERLAARDSANTEWQRDLSVSHSRIGNVRVAQGNLSAALQAFEADLAIAKRLAARDSANTQWQRDLSISHYKIGDVHVAQGNLSAALQAFEASLEIAERLAARDSANTQWQRDVSINHDRIGNVRVAQGNFGAALLAFETALAIRERLAARDSANTEWQRDLSISHDKIGDVRVAQGNLPSALRVFEAALAIRERLAARDSSNSQWQIDLATSCYNLGTCAAAPPDVRRRYVERGLSILEALHSTGRLPPNRDFRASLRANLEG